MTDRRYDEAEVAEIFGRTVELDRRMSSDEWERLVVVLPLALTGAASLGVGTARPRGWAGTRLRQMDDVAERVRLALGQGSTDQ